MHLLLTARALAVSEVLYSGERDKPLEKRIEAVVKMWGGKFRVVYCPEWRQILESWSLKRAVCHLTMYGLPIRQVIDEIRSLNELLLVVGGEKVPREVFVLANWNVAVTHQPISEVSATAIFLDWVFKHKELERDYPDAKFKVVPSRSMKSVVRLEPGRMRDPNPEH